MNTLIKQSFFFIFFLLFSTLVLAQGTDNQSLMVKMANKAIIFETPIVFPQSKGQIFYIDGGVPTVHYYEITGKEKRTVCKIQTRYAPAQDLTLSCKKEHPDRCTWDGKRKVVVTYAQYADFGTPGYVGVFPGYGLDYEKRIVHFHDHGHVYMETGKDPFFASFTCAFVDDVASWFQSWPVEAFTLFYLRKAFNWNVWIADQAPFTEEQ